MMVSRIHYRHRQYSDAEEVLVETLEEQRSLLGSNHPDVLWTSVRVSWIIIDEGRHAEGQAVLLVDQIPDGVPDANANTWVSLGQYRFAAGQDETVGSVNVSEVTVSGKPHDGWNQRVYADSAKWVYVAP